MPRLSRSLQIQKSEIFHVLNRGILKQEIFHDDNDVNRFLFILKKYKQKFSFEIYHWCLMPNHYHLVMELKDGGNISKIIGACQQIYAQQYHRKYRTAGKLFQNRFKSQAIEKESYLMACGRYVERNPLRAKLAQFPWEWAWSSARFYSQGQDDFLTTQNPIWKDMIKQNRELYCKWLVDSLEADNDVAIFRNAVSIVGSEHFRRNHLLKNGRLRLRRIGRMPEKREEANRDSAIIVL